MSDSVKSNKFLLVMITDIQPETKRGFVFGASVTTPRHTGHDVSTRGVINDPRPRGIVASWV